MAPTEVKKPATLKLSKKFLNKKQNERKTISGKKIINHMRSLNSLTKKQKLAIKKRAISRKVEKPKSPRFDHKRNIRSSLKPGPFKFNGVPLRRVNQRYVIATKTRINISGVAIPTALTDTFFRRVDLNPKSKNVDKLFAEEPKKYSVSDERKKLQKDVDLSLLKAIKKHKSSKMLAAYLKSMFSLSRKDYPHKMVF
ncbi:unnamed protein product [Schistocephalus solidus]|uniref:60S ribosomal protein L6 n=1 Tax=Schistocephalus solidus TaxID=70667 RepID=A0A183T4Y0_SCHSO|nr:unnamed protein product [Schistocephalus solidus]